MPMTEDICISKCKRNTDCNRVPRGLPEGYFLPWHNLKPTAHSERLSFLSNDSTFIKVYSSTKNMPFNLH